MASLTDQDRKAELERRVTDLRARIGVKLAEARSETNTAGVAREIAALFDHGDADLIRKGALTRARLAIESALALERELVDARGELEYLEAKVSS